MKTVHHEGNSNFRVQKLHSSRSFKVTSATHIRGKIYQLDLTIADVGQGLEEALGEGVRRLRPNIARKEAEARGEDIALKPDPAIDRAIAANAERERVRIEMEAEAQAIREAAARFLDEQNPLWGQF